MRRPSQIAILAASAGLVAASGVAQIVSSGPAAPQTVPRTSLVLPVGDSLSTTRDAPAQRGLAGPVGPAGATGPRGEVGPQGQPGKAGDPGVVGPAGATGPAGLPGKVGAAGLVGATGQPGATGAAGTPGPPGPRGESGLRGESGPRGEAGPPGPAGATGARGLAGASFTGGDCTSNPCVLATTSGAELRLYADCRTELQGEQTQVIRLQSQDSTTGVTNRNVFGDGYAGDEGLSEGQVRHRTYGWWGDRSRGFADLFLFAWKDGAAQWTCSWTGSVTTG